jgi:penicillin-binding protein 1C
MKKRIAVAAAVLLAIGLWLRLGPIDESLLQRHSSVVVLDRNGSVLYEPLGSGGTRTDWLTSVPPVVAQATLAAEDHRFRSHIGIDPIAVARAAVHNVKAMRVVEGGSTITQQVAKLLLQRRVVTKQRTFSQKTRESILALRLEHRFAKNEILALYLNLAPYGNRITGIARASRAYFGCAPEDLTAAQAAYLAALPQRPGAFNPLRDPARARKRQLAVLARMPLTGDQRMHAKAERLQFRIGARPVLAMHFVEKVLASSTEPRITTTLDGDLQRDVQGIIAARRDDLLRHGARSVAVAVLDNRTGEWLAWEGSGDYFGTSFGGAIDGVTTPRQPGSTLKPFTYALAFERGESPATVLADVPSHFPTAEEGIVYTPRNYDGRHRGPLRIRAALASSQNIPAVAMLAKLGPESLLRFLRNSGFANLSHTADYYGLGLTLGDAEVTLEQLVTAYATFARGGEMIAPVATRRTGPAASRRLVSHETAFWITDILGDAEARAYAFGSGGNLDFPFPVAVKTGTSQAYRDNWTVGYTRDVTVGVWVGNFDRRELQGSSGITGAAPIFNGVMLAAVKRVRGSLPIGDTTPIVDPPDSVERAPVCTLSGMRPSTHCPAIENEWLAKKAAVKFCTWHRLGETRLPPEYKSFAGAPLTRPSATLSPTSGERAHPAAFEIANPPDGATYLIDPTLRMEFQTLRLRALSGSKVAWKIDGRPHASSEWPLQPGRHTITATDVHGRNDAVTIFVK